MRKGEQNIYFFPHIPITNLCKYYQTSEFIKIGIKQVKPQLFSFFVFITTKNMQFYILIRHCKSSLLSLAKVIRKKSRGKVQEFLQNQKPRRARGKEGPPLPHLCKFLKVSSLIGLVCCFLSKSKKSLKNQQKDEKSLILWQLAMIWMKSSTENQNLFFWSFRFF